MTRIQTNIGLISGIPIMETVERLMELEVRPREILADRNKKVQDQKAAVNDVLARLLTVQFSVKRLHDTKLYSQRSATSSNTAALTATVTGAAQTGLSQFTPLQTAQAHQLSSNGLASATAPIGAGTITFSRGGELNEGIDLAVVNGGAGVVRGKIRITDRTGANAEIDLRFARTVDDVLEAINSASSISVTAQVSGDAFQLIDTSGGTSANLRVQEVNQGSTAASLGLAGIDVAGPQATGNDILRMFDALGLEHLNGGNGVRTAAGGPDVRVTFRDNSAALEIDLSQARTVGEVLAAFNAADPARLQASLSASGDRIVLTDLTVDDGGSFAVTAVGGSGALRDLGLDGTPIDDQLDGRRLLAGLKGSLLSTLNGGAGLGALGQLDLTDRSGASASVDLSSAETVQDVLDAINAAGIGIRAELNAAGTGLQLVDTTGSSASHLIAASGDATESAEKLGIEVDAATTIHNGGTLRRQFISENTRLSALNGGQGVPAGTFTVFDASGNGESVTITAADITVDDVLKKLNATELNIEATINPSGDGILIKSTGPGNNALRVFEGSKGTAGALKLLGGQTTIDLNGTPTKVIDGSTAVTVTVLETDSLNDLVTKINESGAGVIASSFNDGSSFNPYRLRLQSRQSGTAGKMVVDVHGVGITLNQSVRAQDALLLLGSADGNSTAQMAASSDGTFEEILPGVRLKVLEASSGPVSVNVTNTETNLVVTMTALVDAYNTLVDKVKEYTRFNPETNARAALQGDSNVLRVRAELSRVLSGRFFGVGTLQSMQQLGVNLKDDGTLDFNAEEFRQLANENPAAVEEFLTTEKSGFADKLYDAIEQMAGVNNSLLVSRTTALDRRIESNLSRLELFDQRLDRRRERLLRQFYNLELALAKIQNNQTAVSQIQALPTMVSTRG